jgi:hypothetical protein
MRKYLKYIIIGLIGCLIYLIFFSSIFKEKVKILERYNFNKGLWFIVKGYYNDSIQYVIDDRDILNKLKDKWTLYKSDDNFATTGGYNIELYNDSGRVMLMDIINDGWISKNISGILSNSDYGTLHCNNLRWIDLYKDKWIKAKQITRQFDNNGLKDKYLDSLKADNKVYILYYGDPKNGNYLNCLVMKKN